MSTSVDSQCNRLSHPVVCADAVHGQTGGVSHRGWALRYWLLAAIVGAVGIVAVALVRSESESPHAGLYGDYFAIAWGSEDGELVVYEVGCPGGQATTAATIRIGNSDSVKSSADGTLVARSVSTTEVDGATRFVMETDDRDVLDTLNAADMVIVDVDLCGGSFMNDDEQVRDGQVNAGGWVATRDEFIADAVRALSG